MFKVSWYFSSVFADFQQVTACFECLIFNYKSFKFAIIYHYTNLHILLIHTFKILNIFIFLFFLLLIFFISSPRRSWHGRAVLILLRLNRKHMWRRIVFLIWPAKTSVILARIVLHCRRFYVILNIWSSSFTVLLFFYIDCF